MIGESSGFTPSAEKEKTIIYSQIRPDDHNAILAYIKFEGANKFERIDSDTPVDTRAKKLTGEISSGSTAVILARDGNKIIGSSSLTDLGPDSQEAWADGTLVDPNYRGRGIGLQLALAQEKIARSASRESIVTIVAVNNIPSIALRLKAGYALVEINHWKSEIGYKFKKDLTAQADEAAVNWANKVLAGELGITEKIDQQGTTKEILVPADDPDVVNKIIANGYCGVSLLTPEDFREAEEKPKNKNYRCLHRTALHNLIFFNDFPNGFA